jgi:hypothetical protein
MNQIIISYIRTAVPVIVGVLLTWLDTNGIKLDQTTTAGLIAFLTGATATIYYVLARILEHYVSLKFGWLLGYAKPPVYAVTPTASTSAE